MDKLDTDELALLLSLLDDEQLFLITALVALETHSEQQ